MDLGLTDKVAVVMASSKGLGKAAALEFAQEGAIVIISSRHRKELDITCQEIKQQSPGASVHAKVCDMSKEKDISAFFDAILSEFGKIDILVNNTGGPKAGGFSDVTDEDWYASFEQNLLSYIRTTRAVLPSMKEQQFGRIINISSSSTKEVLDGLILSNTFRAGMVGFAKTLAREVASDNILVNTIGPGRIETDRVTELDQLEADKQQLPLAELTKQKEAGLPIGRYGQPAEFAKVVVFLASSANTYMTGQSLVVEGGLLKAL
ncbi:Bacilysin biosynthesis oxidoreductase YwfH [Planococcus massiliensis]|uniref:Bacilysin biosynthesis oxidoreductase YwfH n=1 Tax=Planococcus massiliensis TaxID=1499687 RepID=A0A098EPD0_9BACL|nr:SDR family oxidoreductase [Planococcus massiliensis]CEG24134.1 Bacilysin biosynthesis oxidoreductase YwfH [Planococcus massiliensis]